MTSNDNPDRAWDPSCGTGTCTYFAATHWADLFKLISMRDSFLREFHEQTRIYFDPGNIDVLVYAIAYEGVNLINLGDIDGALQIFEGLELFSKGIKHDRGLDYAYDFQYWTHLVRNNRDAAMGVLDREEETRRIRGNTKGVQEILGAKTYLRMWDEESMNSLANTIVKVRAEHLEGYLLLIIEFLDGFNEETHSNDG